ncbi:MAG: ADP-ribose diphosphatase [Enterobacteriaceae bacterium]
MTLSKTSPVKFTRKDIEMISSKPLYQGFFTLNDFRFRHPLFQGGTSKEISREIFERGQASVLLPYDPLRDQVVLIEQLRIAALDHPVSPWLLEMVAGIIEPGETVEEVARREAQEEAGLEVQRCKPILSYLATPGGTTERLYISVGEVDASLASGVHGLAEENEDILVHVVSREQAYLWVKEGVIDNAASVIALQWLQLNYRKLQKEWLAQ